MPDPWKLYDELIDTIPTHITVIAGAAGLRWCQITSSDGGLGMAYTIPVQSRRARYEEPTYAGARLRDIAALARSWNLAEAGMGMAAINAWFAQPDRAKENGFTPCGANSWGQVFDPYADAVAGKVVTVIGHFPFAEPPLAKAAEVRVLERMPHPGDYPDSACEFLVPDADFVFISGSAFVNKTIPRLLELSQAATTIVLGPSTPLSTALFDHGADIVTGFVSPAPAQLAQSIGGLTLAGMHDYGYRVEQQR